MVTTDEEGNVRAIKDLIAQGIKEGAKGAFDKRRTSKPSWIGCETSGPASKRG